MTWHVVHLGDTHGRVDERSSDQYASLDEAIGHGRELAAAGTLALWAHPGDIFHTVSDAQTRNALFRRIMTMADLAPVVIVRGNHDLTGELDVFAWLRGKYPIVVSQRPELLTIETPIWIPALGGTTKRLCASVWTAPYPDKAVLVATGTPPDQVAQVGRVALDNLMMYGAAELAARPDTMKLVLGHGNVVGAQSSTGQPQIGKELEFDRAMFERFDPDVYVGMNHIHKHQQVGRAVFAGSSCRLDFGELEPKGIIVADFAPATDPVRVAFRGWRFVALDVAAMYHVEGELTPEGFTFAVVKSDGERLADGERPASWRGADVRVSYRYNPAELPRLNVALIHAEFAEARSLKIVAIPDRVTDIRAPEVLAAVTVHDKLQAFAEHAGLEWTDELAALAAIIETQPVDRWQADAVQAIAAIGTDVSG